MCLQLFPHGFIDAATASLQSDVFGVAASAFDSLTSTPVANGRSGAQLKNGAGADIGSIMLGGGSGGVLSTPISSDSNDLSVFLRTPDTKKMFTPRTPTPFKKALAAFQEQDQSNLDHTVCFSFF